MKNVLIILSLLSLSSCAIVAISPEVRGVVIDDAGNPIKATVEITHKNLTDKTKSVKTDSEGNFTVGKMRVWTPIPFSAIRVWINVKISALGYESYEYEIEGFENTPRIVKLKNK